MVTAGPDGGSNKDGNLEVAVQYSGPAVLPWLWQPVEQDGETVLLPQAIPHFAGASGVMQPDWLLAEHCRGGPVSYASQDGCTKCCSSENHVPLPQAQSCWCAEQLALRISVTRSQTPQEARRCQTLPSLTLILPRESIHCAYPCAH